MATELLTSLKDALFSPLQTLKQERKEKEITSLLPIWILYLEVIAEAYQSIEELIRELSQRPQFSPITDIFINIYRLIEEGVETSTGAIRAVADDVPSTYFRNFLLRFAKALEVGQSVSEFVTRERKSILTEYRERSEFNLQRAESTVRLISSLNISLIFTVSSILLLSMIVGLPISLIIVIFIAGIVISNFWGVNRLRRLLPPKTLVHIETPTSKRKVTLNATVLMSAGFLIIFLWQYFSPLIGGVLPPLYLKGFLFLAFVPFFLPGYLGRLLESKVSKIEPIFSSFMKDVAITARAKGAPLSQAILTAIPDLFERIKVEYGIFADYLADLRKRIRMGVDTEVAWQHLADDTHSELINKYTLTFVRPCYLGVDPLKVADVNEAGINLFLSLREKRELTMKRFIWQTHVINTTLIAILAFIQSVFSIIFSMIGGAPQVSSLIMLNLYAIVIVLEPLLVFFAAFLSITGMFLIGYVKGGDRYSWFLHLAALCVEAGIVLILIPLLLPTLIHGFI